MVAEPAPPVRPVALAMAVPALMGVFLLVTSVAQPLDHVMLYDGKRLLWVTTLTLLAVLLTTAPSLRTACADLLDGLPRAVPIVLILFLGLGLLSAMRLDRPAYALVEVGQFAAWILLVIGIAAARRVAGRWFDRVALIALGLVGLGVFLQELAGLLAYTALGEEFQYREALIRFVHPRYYNQVQTWSLALLALLPLAFPERARTLGVAAALLIGFQWYLLLMTGARGSILALVGALLLLAVWLPAARRHWWKPHLAGLVIGAAIYAGALATVSAAGKEVQSGQVFFEQSVGRPVMHTTGRNLLWQESLRDIQAHPWLGSGPMHFACDPKGYVAAHPHNFALQVAGEWGLPAAALLGGLIAWLLWRALVTARHRPLAPGDPEAAVRAMALAGVVAAAAHLQVSGLFVGPASQATGALVSGWLLASLAPAAPGARTSHRWIGTAACASLLGISLALCAFAWHEAPQLKTRTVYAYEELGPSAPRFWTDGRACEYSWENEGVGN